MSRFIRPQRLGPVPAVACPTAPVNTVLNGDCIGVMAGLPDASVNMILTDPPYICRYRDRHGRTVANDDRDDWLAPAFREAFRVLADDAVCVSFYGWGHADKFLAAWRAAGFRPIGHLVFAKDYASSGKYLSARHEAAYLLAKGRPTLPCDPLPDVQPWTYTGNRHHPTEKPVAQLSALIRAFCPAGGIVLDPFCGSGSTLVAARDTGRRWLGIELDTTHCKTALQRVTTL